MRNNSEANDWPRDFDIRADRAEQQELLERAFQSPVPDAVYQADGNDSLLALCKGGKYL